MCGSPDFGFCFKYMEHHFNVELAKQYGIEEAILINNIYFWISKNAANDKNYINGRFWTYSSAVAMADLFPYINKNTLARKLNNLVEKGVLIKDNFNKSAYDRTCWYAFTDEFQMQFPKYGYPFFKMKNGSEQNEKAIPYNNTDNNTDIYNSENEFSQTLFPEVKEERKLRGTTESKRCLFSNSRFSKFEDFEKCFKGPEYEKIDLLYYYHSVADWSASKGRMQKDWIAQTRNFIRGDIEKNKLHLKSDFQPGKQPLNVAGAMEFLSNDY